MKKLIMGLFFVTSMMLLSLSAYAATVIWEPTDDTTPINTSLVTFDFGLGITDVAIFDDSDTSLSTPLLQFDGGFNEILFTKSGTDRLLSSSSDVLGLIDPTLTDSDNFIVAVSEDGGAIWTAELTFVQDEVNLDLYYLTFTEITFGNDLVILSDVNPVPVPAALWLFGSAMVGLVVVGRRKSSVEESVV